MNTRYRIPLFVAGLALLAAILVVNTTRAKSSVTTITRVSVDSNGVQGNYWSDYPSISADGRYVAFYSLASNLVNGDTNNAWDVFIHDTQTGDTTRVSVDSNGNQGIGDEFYWWKASISADGHYVAFASAASNLVEGILLMRLIYLYIICKQQQPLASQ